MFENKHEVKYAPRISFRPAMPWHLARSFYVSLCFWLLIPSLTLFSTLLVKHLWNNYLPGRASGKQPPANAGDIRDMKLIPGSGGSPVEGQPTPVFFPGESHGQRSQAGYHPWDRKGSDTTEATSYALKELSILTFSSFVLHQLCFH